MVVVEKQRERVSGGHSADCQCDTCAGGNNRKEDALKSINEALNNPNFKVGGGHTADCQCDACAGGSEKKRASLDDIANTLNQNANVGKDKEGKKEETVQSTVSQSTMEANGQPMTLSPSSQTFSGKSVAGVADASFSSAGSSGQAQGVNSAAIKSGKEIIIEEAKQGMNVLRIIKEREDGIISIKEINVIRTRRSYQSGGFAQNVVRLFATNSKKETTQEDGKGRAERKVSIETVLRKDIPAIKVQGSKAGEGTNTIAAVQKTTKVEMNVDGKQKEQVIEKNEHVVKTEQRNKSNVIDLIPILNRRKAAGAEGVGRKNIITDVGRKMQRGERQVTQPKMKTPDVKAAPVIKQPEPKVQKVEPKVEKAQEIKTNSVVDITPILNRIKKITQPKTQDTPKVKEAEITKQPEQKKVQETTRVLQFKQSETKRIELGGKVETDAKEKTETKQSVPVIQQIVSRIAIRRQQKTEEVRPEQNKKVENDIKMEAKPKGKLIDIVPILNKEKISGRTGKDPVIRGEEKQHIERRGSGAELRQNRDYSATKTIDGRVGEKIKSTEREKEYGKAEEKKGEVGEIKEEKVGMNIVQLLPRIFGRKAANKQRRDGEIRKQERGARKAEVIQQEEAA